MGLAMDATAAYGFSFESFRDDDLKHLNFDFSHGMTPEDVAEAMGIPVDEVTAANTLRAVIKTKYPELSLDYTGVIYGDITVIYVRDSKFIADLVTVELTFPNVFADEKEQVAKLASLFGETPSWLMYSTVPLEYINTMGES